MRQGPAARVMFAVWLLLAAVTARAESGELVMTVAIDGPIGPATAALVEDALDEAEARDARLLILRMDTPGGLDAAMRSIVKAILASSVPVAGYVAPSGARAASAGTYILYACHIAAMAPGTNLGAATPVQIGGFGGGGNGGGQDAPATDGADDSQDGEQASDEEEAAGAATGDAMSKKLVNDAAAYIRGLASLRGRNAEWAEQAVREGASLPAEEAAEKRVIDLLAADLDVLLAAVDGKTVQVAGGEVNLRTADLAVVEHEPDWKYELLAIISNPNVAYILMLIGIYGLIYEFSNPGAVLPGTVGAVSLLLALYAFQLLPVNYAGIALILLGLGLILAEAFVPSFGALGIGGVAAFVIGSLILIDTDVPGFGLSVPLVIAVALASALLLFLIATLAIRSFRSPVVSGSEQLVGAHGEALEGFCGEGSVHLRGENWTARSERPIGKGEGVKVTGRKGLVLLVEPDHSTKE